jgi:tetraacyldisaccharide 4'-kinase
MAKENCVTLIESLLWPLSVPYGAVAHLRARAYRKGLLRQRRLDGAVISVGNLTVGGTGKTPMVLWLAQRLLEEGKRVGILTRGYRGRADRAAHTDEYGDAIATPASTSSGGGTSSDEVRLLATRLGHHVEIGVGADRYARGLELAKQGVDWFVLDDGFQHMQLTRDVDIVMVDATNPFGGGRMLPSGRLREPRTALKRADVIVITRSERAPAVEATIRRDSDAPIFYARTGLDSIRSISDGQIGGVVPPADLGPLFAFCGIGNPSAFVSDLREWGVQVAGHKFFRDHHPFTDRDDVEILSEAEATGAQGLICTEKDLYNLHGIYFSELPVFFCAISLRIDREEEFWGTVKGIVEARRNAGQGTLPLGTALND